MKTLKSLLVLAIVLFASCANNEETKTLNGNWEVISMKDVSDVEAPPPSFIINLETMKVAGFSGCNRFFGSITTQDNSLNFHDMGGTKKACPDFTIENLFITTIPEVKSFEFKLRLDGRDYL